MTEMILKTLIKSNYKKLIKLKTQIEMKTKHVLKMLKK